MCTVFFAYSKVPRLHLQLHACLKVGMFGRGKHLAKSKKFQPAPASPKLVRVYQKRRQWTNEQIKQALKAVQTGSLINEAALDYGVPRTTLKDRLSGRVKYGDKPGPKQYLKSEEETELNTSLTTCASVGYGKTSGGVMGIAQSVAMDKGILRSVRVGGINSRQKDLSLRFVVITCAQIRMSAINCHLCTDPHHNHWLKYSMQNNSTFLIHEVEFLSQ